MIKAKKQKRDQQHTHSSNNKIRQQKEKMNNNWCQSTNQLSILETKNPTIFRKEEHNIK